MPSVRLLDAALATYSYAQNTFAPVAAATDIWQLAGAAGVVTKVRYVMLSGTAAALRKQGVSLIKRSTATSGTTSTNPTISKMDTADATPASVITEWTTLPSGGVGTIIAAAANDTFMMGIVATSVLDIDRAIFNYHGQDMKPITLGGSGLKEYLCVNFLTGVAAVSTISSDKLDFQILWTEQ